MEERCSSGVRRNSNGQQEHWWPEERESAGGEKLARWKKDGQEEARWRDQKTMRAGEFPRWDRSCASHEQ